MVLMKIYFEFSDILLSFIRKPDWKRRYFDFYDFIKIIKQSKMQMYFVKMSQTLLIYTTVQRKQKFPFSQTVEWVKLWFFTVPFTSFMSLRSDEDRIQQKKRKPTIEDSRPVPASKLELPRQQSKNRK